MTYEASAVGNHKHAWAASPLNKGLICPDCMFVLTYDDIEAVLTEYEARGRELISLRELFGETRALLEAHHDADDGPCFVCTAAPTAEQVQYAKSWGYDL